MNWEQIPLFPSSPFLMVDSVSWTYAVVLIILATSVLLTDVARVQESEPVSWAVGLGLTGLGIFTVFAGNPITLLLSWTSIDILESYIRFYQGGQNHDQASTIIHFMIRVFGWMLVLAAILVSQSLGLSLEFSRIPVKVSGYLILAAGLRLGVLPPQPPFVSDQAIRRGLGTLIRFVPVSVSLVILSRVAMVGVSPKWGTFILISSSLAVIYGGMNWIGSKDQLDGRPFWILGMSAFSVLATQQKLPNVSMIWGISLVFVGGFIFLIPSRVRSLFWVLVLGSLGISALPFTPLWHGLSVFLNLSGFIIVLFLLGLLFLSLGYARHVFKLGADKEDIEGWARVVYPSGLVLLPITHILLTWNLGGMSIPDTGMWELAWWIGLLVCGIVIAIMFFYRENILERFVERLQPVLGILQFTWLYKTLAWLYQASHRVITYFSNLLEGDGGVLWAILIMVLIISVIINR
jgi:hypothetical protein